MTPKEICEDLKQIQKILLIHREKQSIAIDLAIMYIEENERRINEKRKKNNNKTRPDPVQ